MARRGSGLRAVVKVAKAIDRANKQAVRDAQRREKSRQRAQAQAVREHQKSVREAERELKKHVKLQKLATKQAFKGALISANEEYLERCEDRAALRKQFIQEVLR
ncbi:hypothetical protein [Psychromonas aquatilis]|uniref:Uncharacterized protein n=1 Tax=Psychromonas aquatilis TaxID=2005072 RepID=A0ABU9GRM5_9GAMM